VTVVEISHGQDHDGEVVVMDRGHLVEPATMG